MFLALDDKRTMAVGKPENQSGGISTWLSTANWQTESSFVVLINEHVRRTPPTWTITLKIWCSCLSPHTGRHLARPGRRIPGWVQNEQTFRNLAQKFLTMVTICKDMRSETRRLRTKSLTRPRRDKKKKGDQHGDNLKKPSWKTNAKNGGQKDERNGRKTFEYLL